MVKKPSSREVFANFNIKAPASSVQAHRGNTRKGLDEKAQQKASERTGARKETPDNLTEASVNNYRVTFEVDVTARLRIF